jgi:hypothetical protein
MRREFNQQLKAAAEAEGKTIQSRNVNLIVKCIQKAWHKVQASTVRKGFEKMLRTVDTVDWT